MASYDRGLVSPSRKYVVSVANSITNTSNTFATVVEVPESYDNNVGGARRFYYNTINSFAVIASCIPYEVYTQETLAKVEVADRRLFLEKSELLEKVKISLSKYYDREILIEDWEILIFLERLEKDATRYLKIFDRINQDLMIDVESI